MSKLKSLLLGLLAVAGALLPLPSTAQLGPSTNGPMYGPNWAKGYVPTPAQWQMMWTNKLDYYAAGLPIQYGGTGATTAAGALLNLGLPVTPLTNAKIYVGNASNQSVAVTPSGDLSMTNAGVFSVNHGSHITDSSIPVSGLVSKSTAVNGQTCQLGSPCTVTVAISTGVTGLGTGVATALGVNVGSAGAPVLFNGAGGTPSSLTLSSATGLPVSTGVTGLGTGIATALAANVGSAGAPVLFNGAGGTPSSLTLTGATGLPIGTGVTGLGTGVATALGVNVGSAGAPVLFNGAGGTPSSMTLTSATGLPAAGIAALAANTVLANATGSSASPTAFAMSACATALTWTAGSGFGCNVTTSVSISGTPAANQVAVWTNASTVKGLTSGNSSLLVTDGAGVPSIATAIPNGVTATTQSANDNSTKVATTEYADRPTKPVLLTTLTASSSASLVYTSLSSSYKSYDFRLIGVKPASNAVGLLMRYSTDGGLSYATTSYETNGSAVGNGVDLTIGSDTTTGAAAGGYDGIATIYNPSDGVAYKNTPFKGAASRSSDGALLSLLSAGRWTGAVTAVNAVQFLFSSGNIASGTIEVWGVP